MLKYKVGGFRGGGEEFRTLQEMKGRENEDKQQQNEKQCTHEFLLHGKLRGGLSILSIYHVKHTQNIFIFFFKKGK